MKFFVTGGAGFIGSHFCDQALERGHSVTAFDNFSTGQEPFLETARQHPRFQLVRGDITDLASLTETARTFAPDWVVHLAANADVRRGLEHPQKDLQVNIVGTSNVLEAARLSGCKRILFSSTGSVYGEPEVFPTSETAPFPEQTSLYATSKLAGEGLISSYCHGFGFTGVVFRFVSILGPRYTHGHVFDFMKKLQGTTASLEVLGDGTQKKSYLHISDLMRGLWTAIEHAQSTSPRFHLFNIGHPDYLQVTESVHTITERLGVHPQLQFTGGVRGWVGDSPRIQLDITRLTRLGWKPEYSLKQSVEDTVDYLREHPELLQVRT